MQVPFGVRHHSHHPRVAAKADANVVGGLVPLLPQQWEAPAQEQYAQHRHMKAALGCLMLSTSASMAVPRRRRQALGGSRLWLAQGARTPGAIALCADVATLEPAPEEVVRLEAATVRCGPNVVLDEVDLQLQQGTRAAILGPNGCGKSTLLRVLAGIMSVESGEMVMSAQSLAWLRQEATAGSTATVLEEAMSEMCETEAQQKLDAATARLGEATEPEEIEKAMAAYEAASEAFESCDGYGMETRATEVLTGLSFTPEDFNRPCSELSGGWQMKVALARALLRRGDLLLLDEPTNHMDASAKSWLAKYLAEELPANTSLIVVTHDRSLLEKIRLNCVVEISEKNIWKFNVKGIEQWQDQRKSLSKKLGQEMKELNQQIKTDSAWAQKWGAKASFAAKAQSRMKGVAVMKKRVAKLEILTRGLPADELVSKDKEKGVEETDGMLPLADMGDVNLRLPDAPLVRGGPIDGVLLSLKDADIGYGSGNPIIGNVNMAIKANARVALLGPNGAGKTTLLRNLYGTMDLQGGKRKLGQGSFGTVGVGLFTQDLAQDLPSDVSPIEYVLSEGGDVETARRTLGALGLKSSVHESKIRDLSGGEKARVALAVFALTPTDVMLLDEPTNHLDRVAVKALADGLRAHKGGAVLVSTHDEAFIDALQVTDKAVVTKAVTGKTGMLEMVSNTVDA